MSAARPLDWDAVTYARASSPQLSWGEEVLARLELAGDETVLDAGCGAGRVTARLLERLPRGRVIAVDGSPAMVAAARARLGHDERISFAVADLAELALPEPVDLVFSTATFHWVPDHPRLFARLHAALRPGGRLAAQCGGAGNVADAEAAMARLAHREPFAPHLAPWRSPWVFATPAQATARLESAGFAAVEAWLEEKESRPEDMRAFLASSVVPGELDRLPEDLHDRYLDALLDELGHPGTLAYVRLNLSARKPRAAPTTA